MDLIDISWYNIVIKNLVEFECEIYMEYTVKKKRLLEKVLQENTIFQSLYFQTACLILFLCN